MKKFLKVLSLVMALAMVFSLLAGCGSEPAKDGDQPQGGATTFKGKDIKNDPIKLAYINISSSGVTNKSVEVAYAETLSMYPNVTINIIDGEYNPTTQMNAIQDCITQHYDCIMLEPLDGEAVSPAVAEAEAAGIPVITINPGCSAVHSLHIQGNDYNSGEQAAQALYEKLGPGKNYVLLDCPSGAKASTRMGTGFEDWITKNTDWTMLEHQYIDNFSMEIANTTMSDFLTKHDNIDAVYGATDDIAMGAVQAITAAGREGDGILVFGNTGYYNAFKAIQEGSMYGTSWCDVYSQYEAVVSMALYFISTGINAVSMGYTETPTVDCSMICVTQENVDQILPITRWEYQSEYSIG